MTKDKKFTDRVKKVLQENNIDIVELALYLQSEGIKKIEWTNDTNFEYTENFGSMTQFDVS